MKHRLLQAVLALSLVLGLFCSTALASYTDTNSHWAKETIEKWESSGLIKGYSDGSFRPNAQITRAEVCSLAASLMALPAGTGEFPDVKADNWFYSAVASCYSADYIRAEEDGSLRPRDNITRQEAFYLTAKAAGLDTSDTAAPSFTDAADIAGWAVSSVNALVKAGMLSGYTDGSVKPNGELTRAEMLILLDPLVPGENKKDGTAAGSLTNLLLEDGAHWMDKLNFNPAVKEYHLTAWLETYGIRFTPVVTGGPDETVKVTMSGSGIETSTQEVKNGQQFELLLTQARTASNPEGTGDRGVEDECTYKVVIEAANGTYTLNVTRPGLQQYVDKFERKTFDMSGVKGAEAGKTMTYWEYVPESYDGSEEYPVVLYLHGVGQRANEATDVLLRNASATTFAYYGKEAIVIAPQCNYSDLSATDMWTDDGFGLSVFGEGAYQILQSVKSAYKTDSNRIYVVGLSMGGQGTCGMLASHPEEWAGAIVNAAPFRFGENNADLPKLVRGIKDYNRPLAKLM